MKICLIGLAGSGKDTAAAMLLEKLGSEAFRLERFAAPLKQVTKNIFGAKFDERDVKEVVVAVDPDAVLEHTFHLLKKVLKFTDEQLDKAGAIYAETIGQYDELSPRQYQQLLGTDIVRAIDPDAWVRRLANLEGNIICPDARFINEVDVFDKVVFISRGVVPKNIHESELLAAEIQLGLDLTTPIHYWLDNRGDLSELEAKVNELVKYIL